MWLSILKRRCIFLLKLIGVHLLNYAIIFRYFLHTMPGIGFYEVASTHKETRHKLYMLAMRDKLTKLRRSMLHTSKSPCPIHVWLLYLDSQNNSLTTMSLSSLSSSFGGPHSLKSMTAITLSVMEQCHLIACAPLKTLQQTAPVLYTRRLCPVLALGKAGNPFDHKTPSPLGPTQSSPSTMRDRLPPFLWGTSPDESGS